MTKPLFLIKPFIQIDKPFSAKKHEDTTNAEQVDPKEYIFLV